MSSRADIESLARRRCVIGLSAILASTATPTRAAEWKAQDDPFTLGVASGDRFQRWLIHHRID